MHPMQETLRERFLARLAAGPLVLDGACGTELMKRGLPAGTAPETWLAERPEAIRELAAAYVAAGASAVYTCTFGANRVRLKSGPLRGRTRELAERAVELARGGAGTTALVLGDLGPTGEWLEPVGDLSEEEAREAFGELAAALATAGVDGLVAETFTDPREAELAVAAARTAAPQLPLLATMTFDGADKGHRTATGATPEDAARRLREAGADAIGVNCGTGPADAGIAVARMHAAVPAAPLIVKPNAGLPGLEHGRLAYATGPDEFARAMAGLAGSGVRLLGGCCGTTPEHLRALAAALRVSPA